MPRGGKRPGAGRKRGSPNKATVARQEAIQATGQTPLEYMLAIMRDAEAQPSRRDEMAKSAAPYVHPKLAAVEHTGKGGGPIEVHSLTDDDLAAIATGSGSRASAPTPRPDQLN